MVVGGLKQGGWGRGRVSKGLGRWGLEGGWGLEGAGGLGGGWSLGGRDGRLFARSFVRSLERTEITPLCSIGPRPLRIRCPKGVVDPCTSTSKETLNHCTDEIIYIDIHAVVVEYVSV